MVFIVGFGVREYTLVFQLIQDTSRGPGKRAIEVWKPVRLIGRTVRLSNGPARQARDVSHIFAVPICSALALDGWAYERFLFQSGALDEAGALLSRSALTSAEVSQTVRKEIQALVMAAEVQHIIDGMPA